MVYEAALISLIRTILIFVGIYFAFKLIFRRLVPFLLKRFINKQQKKYEKYGDFQQGSKEKEGEVHIHHQSKKGKNDNQIGDYIDYEEVPDKEEK